MTPMKEIGFSIYEAKDIVKPTIKGAGAVWSLKKAYKAALGPGGMLAE